MTEVQARVLMRKSDDYLASAVDNMAAGRYTPAAGDAIHAGISAKDAIVMALTGAVTKHKDHSQAVAELKQALGKRPETAEAGRALQELVAVKSTVEYGAELVAEARARALVRRATYLTGLAATLVRLT